MKTAATPVRFTGGMVVPLITPFTSDGSVDTTALSALCEFHIKAGTSCIFVLGTTGEFYGLTFDQRAQVVDTVLAAIDGRIPVICGISGDSTTTALETYRVCRRPSLSGYVASTPYFLEYNQDELCDYFRSLSDVVGSLILYNFPARYRHRIDISTVATLFKEKRAYAIKDTAGDFQYLRELLELKKSHPEVLVLESALQNLGKSAPLGIDGSVQAMGNLFPDTFAKLWMDIEQRRFEKVEEKAARYWAFHNKLTDKVPFIAALKSCMAARGWCNAIPARPTREAKGDQALKLRQATNEFLTSAE